MMGIATTLNSSDYFTHTCTFQNAYNYYEILPFPRHSCLGRYPLVPWGRGVYPHRKRVWSNYHS